MKILKNNLKSQLNIRTEKDYPVKGVEFIDITPLMLQKETLKEMTDAFTIEVKNKNIDYIVAPEARGFLIGSTVATNLNIGFIPIRKKENYLQLLLQQKHNMKKSMEKMY